MTSRQRVTDANPFAQFACLQQVVCHYLLETCMADDIWSARNLVASLVQPVMVETAVAGFCLISKECQGEALCDLVSVHDQKQEELVCQDCDERP